MTHLSASELALTLGKSRRPRASPCTRPSRFYSPSFDDTNSDAMKACCGVLPVESVGCAAGASHLSRGPTVAESRAGGPRELEAAGLRGEVRGRSAELGNTGAAEDGCRAEEERRRRKVTLQTPSRTLGICTTVTDSISTKMGGKPSPKKPFKKPFKKTEHSGKRDKQSAHKFVSNDKGARKRKRPHGKDSEGGERGPVSKKWKSAKSEPKKKLSKEELKATRQQRKRDVKKSRQQAERKDMFDIICQSKQIWGQLRIKKCDEQIKKKSMKQLHDLIRGKSKQVNGVPHDSVRVLQCFLQFGSNEQRQEVFDELKDDIISLCKSQYGRHVVKKLLMYGDKELVASVIQTFKGHVKSMLRHAAASSIIEYAYNDKAVLSQRLLLTEELYGNTFTVCRSAVCNTIDKVLEANPDKVNNILDEMKQILTPMAQKEQVIKHSLVHKVFMDFFQFAPEKQRTEMIESIREAVVYMATLTTEHESP
ncbi:hypothetical protein WMY93_021377 [Mugilogobius chulae]|uniref:PUM-HD domain-containing protein n=1 Tax=Mugilogobius chulae TaxID=88201 RepID=A0AAW0NFE5_9GOBI